MGKFTGNLQKCLGELCRKTIDRKRPIWWKFSEHILPESDRFCMVVLGCCLFVAMTKFHDKFASLQQVNNPNSQDHFQICCTDMYLVQFLDNFAVF